MLIYLKNIFFLEIYANVSIIDWKILIYTIYKVDKGYSSNLVQRINSWCIFLLKFALNKVHSKTKHIRLEQKEMETSDFKGINFDYFQHRVNSLRLECLQIISIVNSWVSIIKKNSIIIGQLFDLGN